VALWGSSLSVQLDKVCFHTYTGNVPTGSVEILVGVQDLHIPTGKNVNRGERSE
jgi:hypothetical protein